MTVSHGKRTSCSPTPHKHTTNPSNRYRKDGQGRPANVVTGLWPGSCLHCIDALRSPRWEDYVYEYIPEPNGAEGNQMAWLGNGWAVNQLADAPRTIDLGWYLDPRWQAPPKEGKPEENELYRIRPFSY